jgi:hypothetical protein
MLFKAIQADTATKQSVEAETKKSVTPFWVREWIKRNNLFEMVKLRMLEKKRQKNVVNRSLKDGSRPGREWQMTAPARSCLPTLTKP